MSHPDYNQRVDHHRCLLIIVKPIGTQIDKKKFNKIYKKISRIQHITIQLAENSREIWLRYKKNYSVESNNWGDFQSHRKILGLITIGKCTHKEDLETLLNCHNTLCEKYANTLFESQCLLFGMLSTDIRMTSSVKNKQISFHPKNIAPSIKSSTINSCDNSAEKPIMKISRLFGIHSNGIYMSDSNPNSLSRSFHETEFETTSRLIPFSEDTDKFKRTKEISKRDGWLQEEEMNSSIIDDDKDVMESETQESQSGIKPNFILYEDFDKCNHLESDIYSFISSLFWTLESKRLDFLENHSFNVPHLITPIEKDGSHKSSLENRKLRLGRMKKHIADLNLQAGLPHEAFSMYTFAIELLKSAGDWLWLAGTYEGQCASSMVCLYPAQHYGVGQKNSSFPSKYSTLSVSKGATAQRVKSGSLPRTGQTSTVAIGRGIFSPEKITDKFREAIVHYSKFRNAAIIEVECCIKAAKAHIMQEKYLIASEFLQNIIYLNFPSTTAEQIQWWSTLSDLYTEMNFHRKAAFYKHTSAVCCVSSHTVAPDWNQCCEFLLQTNKGYKIFYETNSKDCSKEGWPSLQIKILQETIGAAMKTGNILLAIRLLTFILTTFLDNLAENEKLETYNHLGNLTSNFSESSTSLLIKNEIVIPQFHLTKLPYVKSFKLQKPSPHYCPLKPSSNGKLYQESSFICSPIQRSYKKKSTDYNKVDFKWVCEDICEVILEVFNPLSFELQVTQMELLTDLMDFESFPTQLTLAPNSGPHPVTLLGRPLTCGELKILGYSTEIQGINSQCFIKDLNNIKENYFAVDVIPILPHLELTTSLPTSNTYSVHKDIGPVVTSGVTNLYCGENQECTVTLFNDGRGEVEFIDIDILKGNKTVVLKWDKKELNDQIPIVPGGSASFKLNILTTAGHFDFKENVFSSSNSCLRDNELCNGYHKDKYIPKKSSSYADLSNPLIVETYIRFQYSGSVGKIEGYCRRSIIVIIVELLPSLLITSWDVMPSELPSLCYLSLDVFNATNQEMELEYGDKKWIQIDVQNTCRIVIPVQRYSLTSLLNIPNKSIEGKSIKLEDVCKKHLYDLINLKWNLPGADISGNASFNHINNWTSSKLDALIVSPLQWAVFINDDSPGMEDFTFVIGELILVTINLQNISDFTLKSLHLCIQGYQDYQNGFHNYQLDTKLAVIGSDKILINEIFPQNTHHHQCGLMFFNTGTYFLDIKCSSNDYSHNRKQYNPLDIKTAQITSESHTKSIYTWKYTPTIELTILED